MKFVDTDTPEYQAGQASVQEIDPSKEVVLEKPNMTYRVGLVFLGIALGLLVRS